jgi:maltooligosyltrehalose trehalohydrolase
MIDEIVPGALRRNDGSVVFTVWATKPNSVELHLHTPENRIIPMVADEKGYYRTAVENLPVGASYTFRLDSGTDLERERPDPAARRQPDVHGFSEVVDPEFAWTDSDWKGIPLQEYIMYELHVGTFTQEGTFDAIIPCLDYLKSVGITAIEIMPIAQFPGDRGWGYDGVSMFAAHTAYGGIDGFRRLVDACHAHGIAMILDVVYNHLGAEGNYLWDYAPYFTERYHTPWGAAVNLDGWHSDEVRNFFIQNALYWLRDCHVDALRLDAVHALIDLSAYTFLEELADRVALLREQTGRHIYLIAESDTNNPRLVVPREQNGIGMDAHWADELHHVLHVLLTKENNGYYVPFNNISQLVKVMHSGYVHTGEYSPLTKRRHGAPTRHIQAWQLVVCMQNHDQVGNRKMGDRLTAKLSVDQLKLAAAIILLSPFLPLLFMGEEYGETAPFPYFISNTDPALIDAVRKGRAEEFKEFGDGEPPDVASEETFLSAKLNHHLREGGHHKELLEHYRTLIRLRKEHPVLSHLSKNDLEASAQGDVLIVQRWHAGQRVFMVFNFGNDAASIKIPQGQVLIGAAGDTLPAFGFAVVELVTESV